MKSEVVVLDRKLHNTQCRVAGKLCYQSQDDRKERHQHGEQDDRKKTADNAKHLRGELVQEAKGWDDVDERLHVGDSSNERHWNGPEDDQKSHEGSCNQPANDTRMPADTKILPDDLIETRVNPIHIAEKQDHAHLIRCHADISRIHMKDLVMSEALICCLGF